MLSQIIQSHGCQKLHRTAINYISKTSEMSHIYSPL